MGEVDSHSYTILACRFRYIAVYKGMTKPRSANQFRFPFKVEKNGRTGKIYKLGNGTFKTAFIFAGAPKQNTFKTPQSACSYLDAEFSKLDTQRENALSLHPLNGNGKTTRTPNNYCDEGSERVPARGWGLFTSPITRRKRFGASDRLALRRDGFWRENPSLMSIPSTLKVFLSIFCACPHYAPRRRVAFRLSGCAVDEDTARFSPPPCCSFIRS